MQKTQAALTQQKALLKECNKDINEKLAEQQKLQKEMNDAQLQVKEIEHKITKCNKECIDAAKQVCCHQYELNVTSVIYHNKMWSV